MVTAIIGAGHIGTALATDLAKGGEPVVLAARTRAEAQQVADGLGASVTGADVGEAVDAADTVVLAVGLESIKELVARLGAHLHGKLVIDPSNPVAPDADGQLARTLPDGVSSASVVAGLLPDGATLAKAFGTLAAESLATGSGRTPERAVLFYAVDDTTAETTVRRLIASAGFDPVGVGGLDQAIRIEMYGDLHQYGGLDGRLVDVAEATAAVGATGR